MAAKFIILAALAAAVQASGGGYSFSYGVNDPNTRDIKSQHERRVGNSVVGQYSLVDSDGTKRTVEYESNPQSGFNAVVKKDPPHGVHPSPGAYNGAYGYGGLAASVSPLANAAPLVHGGIAPLGHAGISAPLTHNTLAAPLAHGVPASPLANGVLANPLAHGALSGGLAGRAYSYSNFNRYPGYAGQAGYASQAGYGPGHYGYGAGYNSGAVYPGHGIGYGNSAAYSGYGAGYGIGADYSGQGAGFGIGAGHPGYNGYGTGYGYGSVGYGAPLSNGATGNYGAEW